LYSFIENLTVFQTVKFEDQLRFELWRSYNNELAVQFFFWDTVYYFSKLKCQHKGTVNHCTVCWWCWRWWCQIMELNSYQWLISY